MAAVQWCLSAAARWLLDGVSYLTHRIWWSSSDFSLISYVSDSVQPQRILRWSAGLQPSFSIVDDIYWSVVMAFESVALVSMLCCFFVFCGCTL